MTPLFHYGGVTVDTIFCICIVDLKLTMATISSLNHHSFNDTDFVAAPVSNQAESGTLIINYLPYAVDEQYLRVSFVFSSLHVILCY